MCVLFGNGQLGAADPKNSMNETGVFERLCELFPKDEMVGRSFFHSIFREHRRNKKVDDKFAQISPQTKRICFRTQSNTQFNALILFVCLGNHPSRKVHLGISKLLTPWSSRGYTLYILWLCKKCRVRHMYIMCIYCSIIPFLAYLHYL